MNTREFNKKLAPEARTKISTLHQFKKLHKDNIDSTKLEKVVTQIDRVEYTNHDVSAVFEDGQIVNASFLGSFSKCKVNVHRLTSHGSVWDNKCIHKNGRLQLKVKGCKVYLEEFIAICMSIHEKQLPMSLKGWTAHTMDASGSKHMATKLGLSTNFRPDNIEWCLQPDVAYHELIAEEIKKAAGDAYKFSANDETLKQIYQTKGKNELAEYCEKNLEKVDNEEFESLLVRNNDCFGMDEDELY